VGVAAPVEFDPVAIEALEEFADEGQVMVADGFLRVIVLAVGPPLVTIGSSPVFGMFAPEIRVPVGIEDIVGVPVVHPDGEPAFDAVVAGAGKPAPVKIDAALFQTPDIMGPPTGGTGRKVAAFGRQPAEARLVRRAIRIVTVVDGFPGAAGKMGTLDVGVEEQGAQGFAPGVGIHQPVSPFVGHVRFRMRAEKVVVILVQADAAGATRRRVQHCFTAVSRARQYLTEVATSWSSRAADGFPNMAG